MVSANFLLVQIANGFVLGMILILVAQGLSIIFGMMGVVNFAHGDLLLVGAYVTWAVMGATGSLLAGALLAVLVVAILGVLIEVVLLRRTYDRAPILQLLLTFGIAEILREGVQIVWGRTPQAFPAPAWGSGSIDFGLFAYPRYRVFVIGITGLLILGVYLFLNRTNLGMIIRAGSYNRDLVNLLGIDVSRVYLIVFVFGVALAAIAGALVGPIRGAYPQLGTDLLITAFVVVIVGGVGSFRGTVIAGLLIGQITVLTGLWYSQLSNVVIFVAMAAILLVRPQGLLGTEEGVDL